MIGQNNVRIGFIVAQQHVVSRPVLFNEGVFQDQRFGFGVGHRYVHVGNLLYQHLSFYSIDFFPEIAGYAFFQIFRFTNVNHVTRFIVHAVDTRLMSQVTKKVFSIKCACHSPFVV